MQQIYRLGGILILTVLVSCSGSKNANKIKLSKSECNNLLEVEAKALSYLTSVQKSDGSFSYYKTFNDSEQEGTSGTVNVLYPLTQSFHIENLITEKAFQYLNANKASKGLWSKETSTSKAYLDYCALPPDIHTSAYVNLILNNKGDNFNKVLNQNKNTETGLYNYFLDIGVANEYCDFSNWREASLYENLKVLQWQHHTNTVDTSLVNFYLKLKDNSGIWLHDKHYNSPFYFAYLLVKTGSDTIANTLLPKVIPVLKAKPLSSLSNTDLAFYSHVLMYTNNNFKLNVELLQKAINELISRQSEAGNWLAAPYLYNRKIYDNKDKEKRWIQARLNEASDFLFRSGVEALSNFELLSVMSLMAYQAEMNGTQPEKLTELLESACVKYEANEAMFPKALVKYCSIPEEQKQEQIELVIKELADLTRPTYYGSIEEATALAIEALANYRIKYAK